MSAQLSVNQIMSLLAFLVLYHSVYVCMCVFVVMTALLTNLHLIYVSSFCEIVTFLMLFYMNIVTVIACSMYIVQTADYRQYTDDLLKQCMSVETKATVNQSINQSM